MPAQHRRAPANALRDGAVAVAVADRVAVGWLQNASKIKSVAVLRLQGEGWRSASCVRGLWAFSDRPSR